MLSLGIRLFGKIAVNHITSRIAIKSGLRSNNIRIKRYFLATFKTGMNEFRNDMRLATTPLTPQSDSFSSVTQH